MRLNGKVALVTGAGSGIGLATVRRFVTEGARVVAVDIDRDRLESVLGGVDGVVTAAGDVRRSEDLDAAVARVDDAFGRLDVVVTVAGVGRSRRQREEPGSMDITAFTDEDFTEVVEVNLNGTFYALRAALPMFRRNGSAGGSVVTVASVGALTIAPLPVAYTASKAGVVGLTRVAAALLASENIRVNALAPGSTDTPLLASGGPERRQATIDLAPMKRAAAPEEMASAILYLASDEATFVTGQVLSPNGGFVP